MPRTRSPSTGQASRSVQNGIVNTRTAVRPTPPPSSAIVVDPMLIVVWKRPVTATAAHDSGSRRRCRTTRTANSTAMATSVRLRGGKRQITDGPYAETTEQLGGYYIIDVPDLDAALAWAARCPGASHGTMEVRPIMAM